MARHPVVEEFPQKINLLLRSGRCVTSVHALSHDVDFVSLDWLQRVIAGSRPLSQRVFLAIVQVAKTAGLAQSDWYEPLATFGAKLGMSTTETAKTARRIGSGIDFRSRNADPHNLKSLHALIGGYWESFHYAMSIADSQCIAHDLVVIDAPNDEGLLPCRVFDDSSTYAGHCFPVHTGFIYMMVERAAMYDEIAVYLFGRPELPREPALEGVVLCTSSAVDNLICVPCATRVACRFLAATQEDLLRLYSSIRQAPDESFEEAAQRAICTPYFIDSDSIDPADERLSAIKRRIDNTVPSEQIPFALRMERLRRNVAG